MKESTQNTLLSPSAAPHGAIPFGSFETKDIEEALQQGLRESRQEVEAIAQNPEAPTFANTIAALDSAGGTLEQASDILFNLVSANTCDELDELAAKMSPVLEKHGNEIFQNQELFERVKVVKETAENLSEEEAMLLDKTYEAFERSGVTLAGEARKRFNEISEELSRLTVQFDQNLLKETNGFELHVADEARLEGLPDSRKAQAAAEAREKGLDGWLFTLKAPSFGPFMQYCADRELRREMYEASATRCGHGDERDNTEICRRLVNLRREKAALLGYSDFAEYVLRRRMAQSEDGVRGLLNELTEKFMEPARKEVAELEQYARRELGDESFALQPWDFAYWSQRLQKARYGLDSEMLRPYLEQPAVVQGVFNLATRLYGITFSRNKQIPTYHPDVEAYDVSDADGSFLGILYMDFFARKSKQGGAWMTNYKAQWTEADGTDSRPHVSVVTNFTKPTADEPSRLTLGEVETLLHEFGHALHGLLTKCRYRSLSGTSVWWDFVELPSQFMENYAVEKDFLRTFAFHYRTGEPLPDTLIEKVRAARTFNAAYACMRQVSFGLMDMAFYTLKAPLEGDFRKFERSAIAPVRLLPDFPAGSMALQFGHIMSGGYAAGYYSYKWAEVLDADAFAKFKEEGIFNREVARSFRDNILARGGTRHPMDLYVAFRGRRPTTEALLRRTLGDGSASKREDAFDKRYLQMARVWAGNSYCQRRQVGALIVKERMIISDGYNGTPSGFENVCEDEAGLTKPYVLHAEANAITKIARSGNNSDGATLYVTDSPCIECAKLIIQAGIRRVVFSKKYRLTDGIDLLRRAGIQVDYIPIDNNQ